MKFSNNPVRLLAEILGIVALTELGIMLLMPLFAAGLSRFAAGVLDLSLLVLLSGPLVYWRCMIITRNAAAAARPAGYKRQSPSIRPAIIATGLAQALGLTVTALVVWVQSGVADRAAHVRFERAVERLEADVKRRLELPVYGLIALRGVYSASEEVTPSEFTEMVHTMDIERQFVGVKSFAFVERVMRADLSAYERKARAQGASGFKITTAGQAPDLYVVRHIEPLMPNFAAWGFDVGQEPIRREMLNRAVATGEASLSGALTLVAAEKSGKALLYAMPIFRSGADPQTAEQRSVALKGFVAAAVVVSSVMQGAADSASEPIAVELFDGDTQVPANLLFDVQTKDLSPTPNFQSVRPISVGGRLLNLRATGAPEFEASVDRSAAAATGVGGAFASFLMALAVWALASGRMRAQNLARRMTAELDTMARVVQTTDNAVIITDRDLHITWVNAGFTRMSGYTLEEAQGKPPGALLGSRKTRPEVIKILADAAAAGQPCRVELVNIAKDGHEYWLDTDVQPMFDQKGELAGFMEIGTDISDQKRDQLDLEIAQRNLTDLANRLNLAVEGGNDGLWDWMDITLDEQWWSPSYYAQLGYSLDELPATGANFMSVVHPDFRTKIDEAMQLALHHGKPYDQEMLLNTKHLGYRWFRSRGKVFRDAKGNATRVAGSSQDIHDRKLAEAEVKRASALLRGSIDALEEAFALFDSKDCLVMCNRRYIEVHANTVLPIEPGVSLTQILFATAENRMVPEAIGREDEWVQECLALHSQLFSSSQRVLSDGRVLRVTNTRMDDGHSVVFAVDVTHLVHATEAAEAASRSKSQFLANMSHEIRTPMNAILGMLKLLQNTELTTTQLDYAGKTEGAARSLLGLLNDILDFSKVEAGKMTLDPRPFRIDKMLRDLSVILSSNVGNKTIEVLFDVDPQMPRCVVGDDMRLQQVLINLGGNAIKFTSEGEVVLGLHVIERTDDEVLLEFAVKDSGIGIAPESQSHIFSGFSQAEASTTRRFGGTGLGLAISSRLVGLLGGEMKLQSAPGQGSIFSFQLRMAVAKELETSLPLAPPQTIAQRTLIVDDNDIARDLLVNMASTLGWLVDAADSGTQALALVQQRLHHGESYDVVFVDWQMPDMDGWQTNQHLRDMVSAVPGQPMPMVFMVTAHGRDMLSQKAAQEQATLNGFLVKPVTASMLLDAVMDGKSAALTAQTGHNPALATKLEKPKRLQGMRILVVEDNKINQAVAHGLLSQEGAIVTLADNGMLGVDAVLTMQPAYDVVLMDLQMPVMDGFEATRVIRQSLGLSKLPIIAMTANAMASDRDACMVAGMNDHVGKPFELDHLIATLHRHTGLAQPQAQAVLKPMPTVAFLPGDLDTEGALERVGGNSQLYATVLSAFATELVGTPDQLHTQLAAHDKPHAARTLHTLKGLAATVGARHLSQVAAQLEKAVKDESTPYDADAMVQTVRQAIDALTHALVPVLERLQEGVQTASAATTDSDAFNRAQLKHDLQALLRLLDSSDMVAIEVFTMVDQTFGPHLTGALDPMRTAINNLNFAAAALHCKALLQAHH
ncbi:MAG: hypothetical protein RLZ68_2336 [Pseudomonadota bacterium]|jgi:PAS domain S-box-containing protein